MSSRKKRILIFIDWFYPAYKAGGPIKSVFSLVKSLSCFFDFYIVTSNREIDGSELKVETDKWVNYDNVPVIYLNTLKQNIKIYREIIQEIEPQILYFNSLFSLNFTLKPYWVGQKLSLINIVAPRGMFGKGSLAVKPIKKKIFLTLAKKFFFNNTNETRWHATSIQEKIDIHNSLGKKVQVHLARNLTYVSENQKSSTLNKKRGELRLVFISRIHPIKNLLFLLGILDKLINDEHAIYLDIYGPVEDKSYWGLCLAIIEKHSNIKYKGNLLPHNVSSTLGDYHFSVLPSKHENFGNSIVESWLSGVPVIISNQTPWKSLVEIGIGADLSIKNEKPWYDKLIYYQELPQIKYKQMVDNCLIFAANQLQSKSVLEDNKKLFYFNA